MPKKKKQGKQDCESEGRPAGLTLGSFIASKLEAAAAAAPLPSTSNSRPTGPENKPEQPTTVVSPSVTPPVSAVDNDAILELAGAVDSGPKYHIRRTKKGHLPITYENRNKGKKVTVIANVSGDATSLLSDLKHKCGCGGVIKGEVIELQGDRRDMVTKYLKGHPCLR